MKKIITLLIGSVFVFTIYYTASVYLEIAKNEEILYSDIGKTLLAEQEDLSLLLTSFERESEHLSQIADLSTLKTKISETILSIIVLNPQMNFSSGWAMDEDGHPHEIKQSNLPVINKNYGWIDIQLNTSLRTSKAIYIIPIGNQQFLLITYNLANSLNSLRSLAYGFNSYSYVINTSKSLTPPSIKLTPFARVRNAPIFLQAPVLKQWTLAFGGLWEDVYPFSLPLIYSLFFILILWGFLIISITALLLRAEELKPKTLWILSFEFNIFCTILIVFLFTDLPTISFQIKQRTDTFRKTQEFFKNDPSVILIPTAVYLDSLSFPDDTSFLVTGFISQIYPKNTPMEMGFLFPYQSTLYSSTIKEISRWETENTITVLWHFGVGLTAPFSTKFFPFDKRIAHITLWPIELHKNIVFFPNFLNFSTLNVLEKPGFDSSVNPSGWSILDSSFLLENQAPYKFFNPSKTDEPLTYVFALTLEREFLGAFLSNILVLALCIFVAFLVLFIPRDSLLDSLFATISIFVGLIFIAVTNHSSLRATLEVSSFAYCEYLFISFYILLLAITTDFILRRSSAATQFDQNYILAICYWPILLGSFTLMLSLSIFSSPVINLLAT